ncbi:MAG: porin [Xanthobacteraceae bacterium]|nr:porin [Xanthobacteraceae bacterium]
MKMVKSLILGTAVAFAASAGAQAADLPVKAKPVGYVKICPQYGPGFYYIPGTDICLKVGGLVFAEAGYYASGAITSLTFGPTWSRDDTDLQWRSRGYISLDARQNTAYGTLRSYILGGFEHRDTSATNAITAGAFIQYAFIQFAGFTAGTANSFFDFGVNYQGISVASNPWNWANVFAYTANLGNGLSATISLEEQTTSALGSPATIQQESPAIVGNIRLDQAWGSAQVMAATYQQRFHGAVRDDWGWAVGAGIEIKLPMLGAGDTIKFVAVTAEGATEYTGLSGSPYGGIGGVTLGFAGGAVGTVLVTDYAGGVAGTQTDASSVMVQFRHFWTPTLRSSLHAGYNEAYNLNAGGFGGVQVVQYGHSLAWSPVKDLTLALDVLYTEIDANNVETDRLATWFRITRTF